MKRQHRFGLVLTSYEKRILDILAEGEGGLSKAALIRHLIRELANRQGISTKDKALARDNTENKNGGQDD